MRFYQFFIYLLAVTIIAVPLEAKNHQNKVIGGEVWDEDDFPELVKFKRRSNLCTAVVISKSHILTAAHCIPLYFRDHITLKLEHRGKEFEADCRRSPWFRSRGHDIGICIAEKELKEPYAQISKAEITLNQAVHFLGFGCLKEGEALEKDSVSLGSANVQALTEQLHPLQFSTKGHSALCSGDSGGPATDRHPAEGELSLVGINTRSDLRETSFFTDLRTPESIYFLSKNGYPME